jgi:hypothetical protein
MAGSPPLVRQPRQGNPQADRVLGALSRDVQGALAVLLLGGAQFLEVSKVQPAFTSSRRILSISGERTREIVIASGTQTIIPHGLGRPPEGRILVRQSASSSLIDLDVAALTPALDPAQVIAVAASVTATFRIVVF